MHPSHRVNEIILCSVALKKTEGLLLWTNSIQKISDVVPHFEKCILQGVSARNKITPRFCHHFSQTINFKTRSILWRACTSVCPFFYALSPSHRPSALRTLSPVFDTSNCITVQHLLWLSGGSVDPWFSTWRARELHRQSVDAGLGMRYRRNLTCAPTADLWTSESPPALAANV